MPQPCLLIALFFEELSVNYPYRPKIRAGHFVLQVLLSHFPHLRCQSESLKSFSGSSYALSLNFSSSNKTTLITSFIYYTNPVLSFIIRILLFFIIPSITPVFFHSIVCIFSRFRKDMDRSDKLSYLPAFSERVRKCHPYLFL